MKLDSASQGIIITYMRYAVSNRQQRIQLLMRQLKEVAETGQPPADKEIQRILQDALLIIEDNGRWYLTNYGERYYSEYDAELVYAKPNPLTGNADILLA